MIIRSLYSRPRRDGVRVSSREAERKTEFQCTSLSLPYNRPSVSVVDFTEIALKQVTATLDSLKDGNRAEPLSLYFPTLFSYLTILYHDYKSLSKFMLRVHSTVGVVFFPPLTFAS